MYTNLSSLQEFVLLHSEVLCNSYRHWFERELLPGVDSKRLAEALFEAPFAMLSHDAQPDPLFNYANRRALELFGYTWQEFMCLPSRLSAEPVEQQVREQLLQQVTEEGFAIGYNGIRIAKNGSRFEIRNATLWTLLDSHGKSCGQAALIPAWRLF